MGMSGKIQDNNRSGGESPQTKREEKMSYKVKIELDFDTYKPSEEDIFKYIKDLFEDNSLDYELIENKTNKAVTKEERERWT